MWLGISSPACMCAVRAGALQEHQQTRFPSYSQTYLCCTSAVSKGFIKICASFFKGVSMVLEEDWQDSYTINWGNTLENLSNYLCGLGKWSWCENKAFLNTDQSLLRHPYVVLLRTSEFQTGGGSWATLSSHGSDGHWLQGLDLRSIKTPAKDCILNS